MLVSVGYNVLVVSRNSVAIEHVIYIVEYCNDLLVIAVLLENYDSVCNIVAILALLCFRNSLDVAL